MPGTKTLVDGGHAFLLDEDGEIDDFKLEADYHNGPECAKCGNIWCEHCHPGIYEEQCPNKDATLPGLEYD